MFNLARGRNNQNTQSCYGFEDRIDTVNAQKNPLMPAFFYFI